MRSLILVSILSVGCATFGSDRPYEPSLFGPKPPTADQPVAAGESARPRAERGVRQLAAYWRAEDGDPAARQAFVTESFVSDERQLDALHQRFAAALEQVDGHLLEIARALRSWNELELGP